MQRPTSHVAFASYLYFAGIVQALDTRLLDFRFHNALPLMRARFPFPLAKKVSSIFRFALVFDGAEM